MSRVKFDEKTKIWSTCGTPVIYNPNISVGNILLRSMEMYGSKIAQISDDNGEQFSFEEQRLLSIRAAQNLQRRGYGAKNEVIGFVTENVFHLAPIIIASLCLESPICAMHTQWKHDTARVMKMTKPTVIFSDVRSYDMVVDCLAEVGINAKVFTFNGTKGTSEAVEKLFEETGTENDFVPAEVDGLNDTAVIVSSSGSTGPAKGIPLPHSALLAEIDIPNMRVLANGIFFNPCPIYWFSGIYSILICTVNGSTRIITSAPFSPELEMRIIKEYNVTILVSNSYEIFLLLKSGLVSREALANIKHVIGGGCKVPFSVLEEFQSYLTNGHVNIDYGSTEVGAIAFDFPKFSGKDTVGKLINGLTVKVVDDHGNRLGINMNGEICAKSRYNFRGYYKNGKMTDIAIDSEGYFLTGDIGHIDEDGYLYIIDRKKNVIRHPEQYVFPIEIEEFLMRSNDVRCVCVVGAPFDEGSEVPAAFIERTEGATITEEEIYKMIETNMERNCQLLGGIYFVESIPLSESGKPLRLELKKRAAELYKEKIKNSQTTTL